MRLYFVRHGVMKLVMWGGGRKNTSLAAAFRVSGGCRIIKFRISGDRRTTGARDWTFTMRPLVILLLYFVFKSKINFKIGGGGGSWSSVCRGTDARVSARAAPVSTHDSGALLYSCKHKFSFSRFQTFSVPVLYTHRIKTRYIYCVPGIVACILSRVIDGPEGKLGVFRTLYLPCQ